MANKTIWKIIKELKTEKYKWVDLSHELSPETPHWYGFDPMGIEKLFDFSEECPMRVHKYTHPGQYGTHVDAPLHFDPNGRTLAEIRLEEMVYPLVVIDKSKEVEQNPDYMLTIEDLKEWEAENGRFPEGSFVAFCSDWYKRPLENFDNYDENKIPHYPGWDVEAIKWLVEERNIGSIGHETADTDPGFVTSNQEKFPYPGEKYILDVDRIQIELLINLDKVPTTGGIIICSFPKLKGGTGYPARCFAIVPAQE